MNPTTGTTYTPQFGLTNQGIGLQSLMQAINSLQQIPNPAQAGQQANSLAASAQANYPNYQSQQATGLTNQAQLPQLSGQYQLSLDDFLKMHVADQGFASQYGNQTQTPNNQQSMANIMGANTPSANPISGQANGAYTSPQGVVFATPQATQQSVQNPNANPMNPATQYSLANMDVSGLLGKENNLMSVIANNLGKMQSQYGINTGEYTGLVNALQNVGNYDMGLANLQEQQRQFDVTTGQNASPLTAGSMLPDLTTANNKDLTNYRSQYQAAWEGAQTTTQQKAISDAWKNATGESLFPTQLKPSEQSAVKGSNDALTMIQKALDLLNKNKDMGVGPGLGTLYSYMVQNPTTYSLIPDSNVKELFDILTKLKGQGERSIINGRLTGYLQNVFAPAYANIQKSRDDIIRELQDMQTLGQQDLQVTAEAHSYQNWKDIPGLSADTTSGGSTSGTSGTDRATIVSNLKSNGISDDEIHQYLRQIGIDK